MAKSSLPNVSAKFVADVEGMLSDLKRAERATQSTTSAMGKELDSFAKKVKGKFALGDVGKDVLKGAGLFGGFDIARTASEAIVGYWKEAADLAKSIEESTARQLANTMAIIKGRQSPEEKVTHSQAAINSAVARLAEYQDENLRKFTTFDERGNKTERIASNTPAQILQMNLLTEEIQKHTEERDKLVAAIKSQTEAEESLRISRLESASQSDQDRRIKSLAEGLKNQEAAFESDRAAKEKTNEATRKLREENEKLAEKYRELADPTLRFTKQMAEANALAADGKILFSEAADSVARLTREMKSDEASRVNSALHDFFGDLDEQSKMFRKIDQNALEIERIVGRASDGMADAWVDSLKGVEGAWSNLGDVIVTEIMRIVAQLLIVKPMINALGGILVGGVGGTGILASVGNALFSYGGAKASGGAVDAGYTYRVNEDGQEFFRPNAGGTILPVGASAGLRGGGGDAGAIVVNQHYNIGAGVTASQLMPILAMQKRDLLATIADAKRRRTSMGMALA